MGAAGGPTGGCLVEQRVGANKPFGSKRRQHNEQDCDRPEHRQARIGEGQANVQAAALDQQRQAEAEDYQRNQGKDALGAQAPGHQMRLRITADSRSTKRCEDDERVRSTSMASSSKPQRRPSRAAISGTLISTPLCADSPSTRT